MSQQKRMTLYVPNNIRTNMELVDGFGAKELMTTTIVTGVSVVIAFIIYGMTQEIYQGILLILITAAATFMAVKKNEINQSIVSMLVVYFQYSKQQQQYNYAYADPFEVVLNGVDGHDNLEERR